MLLSPSDVMKQVAEAIPEDCRGDVIIVGSLAAGYHFFGNDPKSGVSTKDVDCSTEWFLELVASPPEGGTQAKNHERLSTDHGDFALFSFRFLALAEEDSIRTPFGIAYARPEMMALANLLHHLRIGPDLIADTDWKRSNKDLGGISPFCHHGFVGGGAAAFERDVE